MDEKREEKEVIIENFLCNAVRDIQAPSPDLIDGTIDTAIVQFRGVVCSAATRLPDTRFVLAQIPRNDGYTERCDSLCRFFVQVSWIGKRLQI